MSTAPNTDGAFSLVGTIAALGEAFGQVTLNAYTAGFQAGSKRVEEAYEEGHTAGMAYANSLAAEAMRQQKHPSEPDAAGASAPVHSTQDG